MKTSKLLPAECREEIRAELNAIKQFEGALESKSKRDDFKGMVAGEIADKMRQKIAALAWVLGDDGK